MIFDLKYRYNYISNYEHLFVRCITMVQIALSPRQVAQHQFTALDKFSWEIKLLRDSFIVASFYNLGGRSVVEGKRDQAYLICQFCNFAKLLVPRILCSLALE